MAKGKLGNDIQLRNESIGAIAAEADDDFLFSCFFDHPALAELTRHDSNKMILIGGTGAGKTAILRMMEKDAGKVNSVTMPEYTLQYISNSTIISFLTALEVPLDQFFQALWRHILCLEYIKLRYSVDDEARSKDFMSRIRERFTKDVRKQRALGYLEKWEERFWISYDESVKEVACDLERRVEANFSVELSKFEADAGYVNKLGRQKKLQYVQRLKSIVEAEQLSELAGVISLLSDYEDNSQNTCFLLMDGLDENWVDTDIRYRLIRALIEALKTLRRISGLRIVIALRADLMARVISETKEGGFQVEKYEDYILRLRWTTPELKDMLNKRVNYLFRRKYTKENVFLEDLFSSKIRGKSPHAYIIERSLMRPRDVISFVNSCLESSAGHASVNQKNLGIA